MGIVNYLLRNPFYKKGAGGEDDDTADDENETQEGIKTIDVDGLFVKENDNLALVVDYEFDDVPSWVEWDTDKNEISIVQMGGDAAVLESKINPEDIEELRKSKRLYLVSNQNEEKISHYVTFVVR